MAQGMRLHKDDTFHEIEHERLNWLIDKSTIKFTFYFQANCANFEMKLLSIDNEEVFKFLPNLVYEVIKQKWFGDEMKREVGTEYSWWTNIQGVKLHNGQVMFWGVDGEIKRGMDD